MAFTRARLYFSDPNLAQRGLAKQFVVDEMPGIGIADATIFDTKGVWNGRVESGFVLETLVLANPHKALRIRFEELAEMLRSEFNQTRVLITVETVDGAARFVGG